MPADKSLFFYGPIYHRLFDPQLAEGRQVAVDLIPEGSSVLDIACGTGQLCIALHELKHCRVTGIDLSLRMLEYARRSNPHPDIAFVHADATDLSAFGDLSFDYATMLFVMHELPTSQQARVLREALRVANRGIIADAVSPLPWNVGGIGIRLVEATFGHDHNPHFRSFLANGGISGLIRRLDEPVSVESSSVFWRDCRQAMVVSRSRQASPPASGKPTATDGSPDAAA